MYKNHSRTMPDQNKIIVAFDLYGTLLSTESIANELAKHFGHDAAKAVASLWRRYQLEYTWRLNSMRLYRPFSEVTLGALRHALAESNLSLSTQDEQGLMKAYDSLHVFPEVPQALQKLIEDRDAAAAYVFSNGTHDMVSASVMNSPDLKPYVDLFEGRLVTVDEVQAFKPSRHVYEHLLHKVGKPLHDPQDVWLVSGNPFDVVGAKAAGFETVWIDRAGKGWTDRLGDDAGGEEWCPVTVTGVDAAVDHILQSRMAAN